MFQIAPRQMQNPFFGLPDCTWHSKYNGIIEICGETLSKSKIMLGRDRRLHSNQPLFLGIVDESIPNLYSLA
jgi:hypothetical protein